jgi:hypothetical protein
MPRKKNAKAAQNQVNAGKTTEAARVVMVKKEPGEAETSDQEQGNNNVMAAPVTDDGAKPAQTKKPLIMDGKTKTDAIASATILRLFDGELTSDKFFTIESFPDFIASNAGNHFKPVPLLAIDAYNRQKSKKTIYVLSFVWDEDGERTKAYFARCHVVDPHIDQPDEAPEDEPEWVEKRIKAKANNYLVLVKNVDDEGNFSASPFRGHTKSVLLVSPGLLFYTEE